MSRFSRPLKDKDRDFFREGLRVLSQALMEREVGQHLKAERYEHTAERTGRRGHQHMVRLRHEGIAGALASVLLHLAAEHWP